MALSDSITISGMASISLHGTSSMHLQLVMGDSIFGVGELRPPNPSGSTTPDTW